MIKKLILVQFTKMQFLEAVIHHDICVVEEVFNQELLEEEDQANYLNIQTDLHNLYIESFSVANWYDLYIEETLHNVIIDFIDEVERNKKRVFLQKNIDNSLN